MFNIERIVMESGNQHSMKDQFKYLGNMTVVEPHYIKMVQVAKVRINHMGHEDWL